jgi:hypothetical protein
MAPTAAIRRRSDDSLDSERRNFISADTLHLAQLPTRIPSRCVARLSSSLAEFGEPRDLFVRGEPDSAEPLAEELLRWGRSHRLIGE